MDPIYLRTHTAPETFNHSDFIANICKYYKPNVFLEYGVSTAIVSSNVSKYCKRVIGVDVNYHENMKNIHNFEFHKMTTREFKPILNNLNCKIDCCLIDADHESHSVFQDFCDVYPKMEDYGIIFLHDTFPVEEKYLLPTYCNDCYKVPYLIKHYFPKCEIFTCNVQPGLTMVKKMPVKNLEFHNVDKINYSDYEKYVL